MIKINLSDYLSDFNQFQFPTRIYGQYSDFSCVEQLGKAYEGDFQESSEPFEAEGLFNTSEQYTSLAKTNFRRQFTFMERLRDIFEPKVAYACSPPFEPVPPSPSCRVKFQRLYSVDIKSLNLEFKDLQLVPIPIESPERFCFGELTSAQNYYKTEIPADIKFPISTTIWPGAAQKTVGIWGNSTKSYIGILERAPIEKDQFYSSCTIELDSIESMPSVHYFPWTNTLYDPETNEVVCSVPAGTTLQPNTVDSLLVAKGELKFSHPTGFSEFCPNAKLNELYPLELRDGIMLNLMLDPDYSP